MIVWPSWSPTGDRGGEVITMRFYRLEHYGCAKPGHGPINGGCGCDTAPDFGYTGPIPPIYPHERCGVTREQLPEWWSYDITRTACETAEWDGWYFLEWDGPAREVAMQVVFNPAEVFPVRVVPWREVLPTHRWE